MKFYRILRRREEEQAQQLAMDSRASKALGLYQKGGRAGLIMPDSTELRCAGMGVQPAW
jgi:hypothetical protein